MPEGLVFCGDDWLWVRAGFPALVCFLEAVARLESVAVLESVACLESVTVLEALARLESAAVLEALARLESAPFPGPFACLEFLSSLGAISKIFMG